MTVVRAAAVQISPVLYSREATVEKVVRKVHELGRQGVQFDRIPTAHVHERAVHPKSAAEQGSNERLTTVA